MGLGSVCINLFPESLYVSWAFLDCLFCFAELKLQSVSGEMCPEWAVFGTLCF